MTPYIRYLMKMDGIEDELILFEKIRSAVQQLPDLDLGVDAQGRKILLNCHMLARAAGQVFGLHVQDGWFHYGEHSWLVTPHKHCIDVYPVGILTCPQGGPMYVDRIICGMIYQITLTNPETKKRRTADYSSSEKYLHGKVDLIAKELSKYAVSQ